MAKTLATRVDALDCDDPTPPGSKAKRLNLATVDDVRAEMARVYREMRYGDMPLEAGTKLTFVLGQLARVTEVTSVEHRMRDLEQRLKKENPHGLGYTPRKA